MTFANSKTRARYTGELVPDPADYNRPVLVLSPKEGGENVRIHRESVPPEIVLVDATLNEVSLLDRGGFVVPRPSSSRRPARS